MTKIGDYDITKHLSDIKSLSDEESNYLLGTLNDRWKDHRYINSLPSEKASINDLRTRILESKCHELDTGFLKTPLMYYNSAGDWQLPRFGVYSYNHSNELQIKITNELGDGIVKVKITNGSIYRKDKFGQGAQTVFHVPEKILKNLSIAASVGLGANYFRIKSEGEISFKIEDSKKIKMLKNKLSTYESIFNCRLKTHLSNESKKSIEKFSKYFTLDEVYIIVENDQRDFQNIPVFKDNIAIIGNIEDKIFLLHHIDAETMSKYKDIVYRK